MKQVDSALRRAAVLKQREADTAINQMMFGMNQANMIDSFGQPRFGGRNGGGDGGGGNSGDSNHVLGEGGTGYHLAGDSSGGLNGARGGGEGGGGGELGPSSSRNSVGNGGGKRESGSSGSGGSGMMRVDSRSRDASPNFSGSPASPALATRRTSMTIADPLQMVRMLDRTYVHK